MLLYTTADRLGSIGLGSCLLGHLMSKLPAFFSFLTSSGRPLLGLQSWHLVKPERKVGKFGHLSFRIIFSWGLVRMKKFEFNYQ